jgi:hypothetical protein
VHGWLIEWQSGILTKLGAGVGGRVWLFLCAGPKIVDTRVTVSLYAVSNLRPLELLADHLVELQELRVGGLVPVYGEVRKRQHHCGFYLLEGGHWVGGVGGAAVKRLRSFL